MHMHALHYLNLIGMPGGASRADAVGRTGEVGPMGVDT